METIKPRPPHYGGHRDICKTKEGGGMQPADPNPRAMFIVSSKGVRHLETEAGPLENAGISNTSPILPIETATLLGGCFFILD